MIATNLVKEIQSLKHEIIVLKVKDENEKIILKNEIKRLNHENQSLLNQIQSKNFNSQNLAQTIKDMNEDNITLNSELVRLIKLNKTLSLKADERKKNLKQLFELVTEKEEELKKLRSQNIKPLVNHSSHLEEVDNKLNNLTDFIDEKDDHMNKSEKVSNHSLSIQKTSARKINISSPLLRELDNKSKEVQINSLIEKVIELDRKKFHLEEIASISQESTSQKMQELVELLNFLEKEKENHIENIKSKESNIGLFLIKIIFYRN